LYVFIERAVVFCDKIIEKQKGMISMAHVRFLHTADLHLDSPFQGLSYLPPAFFNRIQNSTFESLKNIVDIALEQEVDFVVIAGDLYDGHNRSLRAQSKLRDQFERLGEKGIHIYICHGNHDHLGGQWTTLTWPSNVHLFTKEEVDVIPFVKGGKPLAHLYGFSYHNQSVLENKSTQYEKIAGAPFHIGVLHGTAEGNIEHDRYAPFSISHLLEKEFDYWALGHIHKRQTLYDDPPIIYPGNIQGLHRNEAGEKGCYVIDLDGRRTSYTFHPAAAIHWESSVVYIKEHMTVDELLSDCVTMKETYRERRKGTLLTLIFKGEGDLHHFLQDETNVHDLLAALRDDEEDEQSFVWAESIKVETKGSYNRDQLRKESHFVGELLHLRDQYDNWEQSLKPLFGHRKGRRFLDQLNQEEKEEILQQAESLLLHHLIKD
jgi:exonuclease SbcD